MATPDNDPRLEPGFVTTDLPADTDPAEWAQLRPTVVKLGLGRKRVFSAAGRDTAAERWPSSAPGSGDESSRHAPITRSSYGYFVPLRGSLGILSGACANEYSPSDARIVSLEHSCRGHSDAATVERTRELPASVFDTIGVGEQLFG